MFTEYASLIRPERAYTIALINYATGEVRISACDQASYATRHLFHAFSGEVRAAAKQGALCDIRLVNCTTGVTLLRVNLHFGELKGVL